MARLDSSTQVLLEHSLLCAKELLVWEESSSSCPDPQHLTVTDETTDVASNILKWLLTVLSAILWFYVWIKASAKVRTFSILWKGICPFLCYIEKSYLVFA